MKYLCLVFMALICTCANTAENLVMNNSFKSISRNTRLPNAWRLTDISSGAVVRNPDNREEFCLGLNLKEPTDKAFWIQYSVKMKAGKKYELSFSAKAEVGQEYIVYLEISKPQYKSCSSGWITGNGKWQEYRRICEFPEIGSLPYLVFKARKSGKVLLSKLSVRKTSDNAVIENLKTLVNGDFEQGNTGWILSDAATIQSEIGRADNKVLALNANAANLKSQALQGGLRLKSNRKYVLQYDVKGTGNASDITNASWFRVFPSWKSHMALPSEMKWQDVLSAWQTKKVEFVSPPKVYGRDSEEISVICELRAPGGVEIDNIKLMEAVEDIEQALSLTVDQYRGSSYCSFPVTEITGNVSITSKKIAGKRLLLKDAKGAVLQNISCDSRTGKFSFPMPEQEGRYTLCANGLDGKGMLLVKKELSICNYPSHDSEVVFDRQKICVCNGEKFFPVGLWSLPAGIEGSLDEQLRQCSMAGFNAVRLTADEYSLSLAQKYGMKIINLIPEFLPFGKQPEVRAKWEEAYRMNVAKISRHPALLAHFISDEPLWRGAYLPGITETYRYHLNIDPYHPIFMNGAPRNTPREQGEYAVAADIFGIDIYPVPHSPTNTHSELPDKTLSCVGKYTELASKAVDGAKPVWMTLQGFSWDSLSPAGRKKKLSDRIFPNHKELRFMSYNAIQHGATGVLFWGTAHEYSKEFWNDLSKTAQELRTLSPLLTSETVYATKLKTNKPALKIMHKKLNELDCFIVVNESNSTVSARFKTDEHKSLKVLFEDRKVDLNNSYFSDNFSAFDVHVYCTGEFADRFMTTASSDLPLNNDSTEDLDSLKNSNWIWYPGKNTVDGHKTFFRRTIEQDKKIEKADLIISSDDYYQVYLNGKFIGADDLLTEQRGGWNTFEKYDVTSFMKNGHNLLAIFAEDAGKAPCGMIALLRLKYMDEQVKLIGTNNEWLCSESEHENWNISQVAPTSGKWVKAAILAECGGAPWKTFYISPVATDN